MSKKYIVTGLFILVLLISSTSLSAIGIGAIVGEPTGLSLKIENFPIVGIGWSLKNNSVDATVDMWIINNNFVEMLDWYFGFGAKLGFDPNSFRIGARFPIGLQWWLPGDFKGFELFAEVAPGFSILPDPLQFDIGGGIGLRYHF